MKNLDRTFKLLVHKSNQPVAFDLVSRLAQPVRDPLEHIVAGRAKGYEFVPQLACLGQIP